MGRLVKIAVVIALLWCGWWLVAATVLERGVAAWLEDRRSDGWDATADALNVSGFPLALSTGMQAVTLADPVRRLSVEAASLDIDMPAYWPGHVTVRLPETPVRVALGDAVFLLRAQEGRAELNLHPGNALELERLNAQSGPWQLNTPQGNLLSADDFAAEVTQDNDVPAQYRFALNAARFAPGDLIRVPMQLPSDWPLTFETFVADVTVLFDRPIDRQALEARRPQPRSIDIRAFDLIWGDLRLTVSGRVEVDAEGTPDGGVTLSFRNWQQALELLKQTNIIRSDQTGQAEIVLRAIASSTDDPADIDIAIGFREGQLFLGPINLGPAPRIILR